MLDGGGDAASLFSAADEAHRTVGAAAHDEDDASLKQVDDDRAALLPCWPTMRVAERIVVAIIIRWLRRVVVDLKSSKIL